MKKYFFLLPLTISLFFLAGCAKTELDINKKIESRSKKNSISDQGFADDMTQENGYRSGGQIVSSSPTRWVVADNFIVSLNGNTKIEIKIWADRIEGQHNHLEVPVDPDFVLTGGGARITSMDDKIPDNGMINALLSASYPVDDNTFSTYAADSKDHEVVYYHRLTVYAIGMKVFYYSPQVGDYVPYAASVIKSQMGISHVSVPFQNGQYSMAQPPFGYSPLCAGSKLTWPAGQSGLLLTEIILADIEWGGGKGKDHAITTTGGSNEGYCLYFHNQNPQNPSEYLLDMNYSVNISNSIDITQNHQTIYTTMPYGYLLASVHGGINYTTGYGRMLYALFPANGQIAVVSSKDHLESDISGRMYVAGLAIRPAN